MVPRRLQRLPTRILDDGLIVHLAVSVRARLLGLALLRAPPPPGHALLIPHCRSVHTFGMRFPIDVAFLDERGGTLRMERRVPARRVLTCRAAVAVLEWASAGGGDSEEPAPTRPPPPGARAGASEP